ncbi:hypothetical protein YC2023_081843 [Brassica napus]
MLRRKRRDLLGEVKKYLASITSIKESLQKDLKSLNVKKTTSAKMNIWQCLDKQKLFHLLISDKRDNTLKQKEKSRQNSKKYILHLLRGSKYSYEIPLSFSTYLQWYATEQTSQTGIYPIAMKTNLNALSKLRCGWRETLSLYGGDL